MAKKSVLSTASEASKKVSSNADRRARLKAIVMDRSLPIEERFEANMKLAQMPRNGAKIRLRNRCQVTGRPRGYYRKLTASPYCLA